MFSRLSAGTRLVTNPLNMSRKNTLLIPWIGVVLILFVIGYRFGYSEGAGLCGIHPQSLEDQGY